MAFRFPLFSRRNKRRRQKFPHRKTRPLLFQPLESRTLMAANIFVRGDELQILANNIADDPLEVVVERTYESKTVVYEQAGAVIVQPVTVEQVVVKDLSSHVDFTFPGESVKSIRFMGTIHDDRFTNKTDRPSIAYGWQGNDELIGGSAADTFFGHLGNDVLDGRGGDDVLYGDWLPGTAYSGNDYLIGGPGSDKLYGSRGNDTYIFQGADRGNDQILYDNSGANTLDFSLYDRPWVGMSTGPGGRETFEYGITMDVGQAGSQVLNTQGDLELLLAGSTIQTVIGSPYSDVLRGDASRNILFGGAGNDQLFGNGGDDDLYGGAGDDRLAGEAGNDRLYGEADRDTYVYAGSMHLGTDIIGDNQNEGTLDFADLGAYVKADLTTGTVTSPLVMANLGSGHTIVDMIGSEFFDTLTGNDAANRIEGGGGGDNIFGLGGGDTLLGGDGADRIYGGEGQDTLDAGAGADDVLSGENGNDTLIAGYASRLYGGRDDDAYVFRGNESLGTVVVNDYQGIDTLMFNELGAGIDVDLAETSDAVRSSLVTINLAIANSIEHVMGTPHDDKLRGNRADNWLVGVGGKDEFEGRGGNDTYVAAADIAAFTFAGNSDLGHDTLFLASDGNVLDFRRLGAGVTVDLQKLNNGSQKVNDLLTLSVTGEIQHVIGSEMADKIWGDDRMNYLSGRGGDDELHGRGGEDALEGGAGDDQLFGGAGADVYAFNDYDVLGQVAVDLGSDFVQDRDGEANVLLFEPMRNEVKIDLTSREKQRVAKTLALTLDADIDQALGATV